VTTPRSVPLNLEDVCQRLTSRVADLTAQLVIAESTRDAALKENEKLKARLDTGGGEVPVDESSKHTQGCELPADHMGVCRAVENGDAEWRTGPNVD